MKRRGIIKFSAGVGLLGTLGFSFAKLTSETAKFEVVLILPENMSYDQYLNTIPAWVDVKKYQAIVEKYTQQGHLLSSDQTRESKNRIIKTYYFSNTSVALQFCSEAISQCNYNFEARAAMGIVTSSYINGIKKEFSS